MATDLGKLKTLFSFTDDDLIANRSGWLSERQKAYLLKELDDSCISTAAAAFTVPVLLLMIGGFFLLVPSLWDHLGLGVIIAGLGWLLLMFIVLRVVWWMFRWVLHWFSGWEFMRRWLCRGEAEAVLLANQGMVATFRGCLTLAHDDKIAYAMINGEIVFSGVMTEIDPRLWELEPDAYYVIYFVPEFFWIVAVEPIDERVKETS